MITAWRIYVSLVCCIFLGPLVGIVMGVSGFPAAGMAMFILAAACAAIVLLLLVLSGFLMIASLFRGPPTRSPYPYWYAWWRWHRHHWLL